MKECILIISFCTLFAATIKAQSPIIPISRSTKDMAIVDSAHIRVWYALNALDISNSNTYDDLQRLEIGNHVSKYYSFFVFNSDSLVTEWSNSNRKAQGAPIRLGPKGKIDCWNEYQYSEYFKDLSLNTFTEYSRMPGFLQNMNSQYTEEMPVQNWEIGKDTLTILGYSCQQATCLFRGREYTVWFSMDIPLANGPWKFGGLPGLILKVSDKDNLFNFECVKIECFKRKIPIRRYKDYNKYRRRQRTDVLKIQREANENFAKVAGLKVRGTFPTRKPHHYMELE